MGIEEALEEPAFWILGGGGVVMEIIGFLIAKKAGLAAFPMWQFGILIIGTLIAAAVFATRG